MNRYPLWKGILVLVCSLLGFVYALPNVFGEDPSIQVSPLRGAQVDEGTRDALLMALTDSGITPKASELGDGRLLIRFTDTTEQLKAVEPARKRLGDRYVVALNLAPSTPGWLVALRAKPMYLGLDLRGGVHFLLQVDMASATRQAMERYAEEMRTLLREAKIRYTEIERKEDSVVVRFADAEARTTGSAKITADYPKLLIEEKDAGDATPGLVLRVAPAEQEEMRRFALEQNITTLRNRVNELGVAEPVVQQQGTDRIVVQLPGVQDTARAKEILGATATLEYRLVDTEHNAQDAEKGKVPPGSKLYRDRAGKPVLLQKRIIATGDQITHAASGIDTQTGTPMVSISLDARGGKRMLETTREAVGKPMAVVFIENRSETKEIDGKSVKVVKRVEEVINVASIREPFGKRFQTTGLDSPGEARNLALLLRAGSLAAPVDIIEERTVGPSLGRDNIDQGSRAVWMGFLLVIVFMAIYYKLFGVISGITLGANVLLLVAILSVLQATLTLPGIAGIALTVGMAVDANVLIYERIREELRSGNSPIASIHAGFERAFDTIADSNITTLIAGLVLFALGTGPVKGFAVVLSIGILTSMFTAVVGTRALVQLVYGRQRKVASLSI